MNIDDYINSLQTNLENRFNGIGENSSFQQVESYAFIDYEP